MGALTTIVFTGTSGGGKTTALRAVEDLGFYCVDNLPLPLLGEFIETMEAEPLVDRAALVVDARLRKYTEGYALAYQDLSSSGNLIEVVYIDANDEALVRRFSQTRRRHPLGGADLRGGLAEERALLAQLRAQAGTCIDTSEMTPHQLKGIVQDRYRTVGPELAVSVLSFGFRYGLPSHADLVFDVRFLPNPFFVQELRRKTGRDPDVAYFVLQSDDAGVFLAKVLALMDYLLPRYETEGKVYLTVAIGCTGGRHRSVAIAERLGSVIGEGRPVVVRHRDIER